jgi:hypothetical protein
VAIVCGCRCGLVSGCGKSAVLRAKKIHSMPSFGGEVKPSVTCRRFAACKRTLSFTWKSESQAKFTGHILAQFRPSLSEISRVAWRGAPLEITGGNKGDAQRTRTLKAYMRRGGSPVTAIPIYHLSNPPPATRKKFLGTPLSYFGEHFVFNLININLLKTERRQLHLNPQSVPRCKHFSSRL